MSSKLQCDFFSYKYKHVKYFCVHVTLKPVLYLTLWWNWDVALNRVMQVIMSSCRRISLSHLRTCVIAVKFIAMKICKFRDTPSSTKNFLIQLNYVSVPKKILNASLNHNLTQRVVVKLTNKHMNTKYLHSLCLSNKNYKRKCK